MTVNRTTENYKIHNRKRVQTHRRRKNAVIRAYKQEKGCFVCGESDPIVLDFHHRTKESKCQRLKRKNNLSFWQLNWNQLFLEMEKCDVLCANCHRRITYQERNE